MPSKTRLTGLWRQASFERGESRNHSAIRTFGHSMRHQASFAFRSGNLRTVADPFRSFVRSFGSLGLWSGATGLWSWLTLPSRSNWSLLRRCSHLEIVLVREEERALHFPSRGWLYIN